MRYRRKRSTGRTRRSYKSRRQRKRRKKTFTHYKVSRGGIRL